MLNPFRTMRLPGGDALHRALAEAAAVPFRVPPEIRLVRVKAGTGEPALPGDDDVILEAFKAGSQPTEPGRVLEGLSAAGTPVTGTGGLY